MRGVAVDQGGQHYLKGGRGIGEGSEGERGRCTIGGDIGDLEDVKKRGKGGEGLRKGRWCRDGKKAPCLQSGRPAPPGGGGEGRQGGGRGAGANEGTEGEEGGKEVRSEKPRGEEEGQRGGRGKQEGGRGKGGEMHGMKELDIPIDAVYEFGSVPSPPLQQSPHKPFIPAIPPSLRKGHPPHLTLTTRVPT